MLFVTTLAREDCLQALAKIPSGDDPPSFHLPANARPPKRTFPNIVEAGNCRIAIHRIGEPPGPVPVFAAHIMFSDLWPAVKAAAEDILYTCVSGNVHLNSGRTFESVMIEGRSWNFMVNVRPLMKLQSMIRVDVQVIQLYYGVTK